MAATNANVHVREPSAIPAQHIDPQEQQGRGLASDQGVEVLTPIYDCSIQTSRQDLDPDAPILIDTLSFSVPIFDLAPPYSDQTSKLTLRDQTRALVFDHTSFKKQIGPGAVCVPTDGIRGPFDGGTRGQRWEPGWVEQLLSTQFEVHG